MINEISFSKIATNMKPSKIRELMKFASMPGVISLAGGMPDPLEFPFDNVKSIINNWDNKKASMAMQYGPTPGYSPLVENLKKRMNINKKINLDNQELLVTTGGQQAIFLLSRLFIDYGDTIIIEQPSFIGAVAAFLSNGADFKGVPLENDGVDINYLENLIKKLLDKGKKIKFFYTIPTFQNPAGVSMSIEKRKTLYNLSVKYDIIIIEDDPYGDLYFTDSNENYIPVKSFGNDAPIIYIGSFSKVLCPGFRLGWCIGDKKIIDKLILAKESLDACSSTFGQVIANDYLDNNYIDDYLHKMRKVYKNKKEYMLNMIKKYMPEGVKSTNPDGGFFVYLELPQNVDADRVFEEAFKKKVFFVSGEPFHIDPIEGKKHIRLSYSNSTEEDIAKGIEVIGDSIKFVMKK